MRYKKYLTVKEWKRFDQWAERVDGVDITSQEILCAKYDIILTDWKTKKEKILETCAKMGKVAVIMGKQSLVALDNYSKASKPKRKRKK
jgi:hypothetical protein